MQKSFLKNSLIALTIIILAGCTGVTVPNIVPGDETGEFNFSGKALPESYVTRKLETFAGQHKGSQLLKVLLYAKYKGTDLTGIFKSAVCGDSDLKTFIFQAPEVQNRMQNDAAFSLFMNNLGSTCQPANSGQIITIAGTGTPGFDGDGHSALNALFDNPEDIAVDSEGNVYVADSNNNRIRKIDHSTGEISTIAGNGAFEGGAETGPALGASLSYPTGVVVAPSGIIYITDSGNAKIRKVDLDGNISTVAGNGNYGYNGDNIPAVNARLDSPNNVDLDNAGNLYIADWSNNRVRKVTPGGTITTLAGGGAIEGSTADDGFATDAALNEVSSVAVDRSSGKVYICERGAGKIRVVGPDGKIHTFAGNGTDTPDDIGDGGQAVNASLLRPYDLAVDNAGNVYINDYGHTRIRKVTPDGIINTVAGNGDQVFNGDGILATAAAISTDGIAVDGSGNLFLADIGNYRIREVFK
jgi:sugar lactone lactonase YvrE